MRPALRRLLTALLRDLRGEIDLVLDRHLAHVAAATRRFLHAHCARLRLHFLPGYAPDLNPDEHVWTHVKAMFRQQPVARNENLGSAVDAALTMIQENGGGGAEVLRASRRCYVKKVKFTIPAA